MNYDSIDSAAPQVGRAYGKRTPGTVVQAARDPNQFAQRRSSLGAAKHL